MVQTTKWFIKAALDAGRSWAEIVAIYQLWGYPNATIATISKYYRQENAKYIDKELAAQAKVEFVISSATNLRAPIEGAKTDTVELRPDTLVTVVTVTPRSAQLSEGKQRNVEEVGVEGPVIPSYLT